MYLPKKPGFDKTIIFDLDETLVHCVNDPAFADIIIDIPLPSGRIF